MADFPSVRSVAALRHDRLIDRDLLRSHPQERVHDRRARSFDPCNLLKDLLVAAARFPKEGCGSSLPVACCDEAANEFCIPLERFALSSKLGFLLFHSVLVIQIRTPAPSDGEG